MHDTIWILNLLAILHMWFPASKHIIWSYIWYLNENNYFCNTTISAQNTVHITKTNVTTETRTYIWMNGSVPSRTTTHEVQDFFLKKKYLLYWVIRRTWAISSVGKFWAFSIALCSDTKASSKVKLDFPDILHVQTLWR